MENNKTKTVKVASFIGYCLVATALMLGVCLTGWLLDGQAIGNVSMVVPVIAGMSLGAISWFVRERIRDRYNLRTAALADSNARLQEQIGQRQRAEEILRAIMTATGPAMGEDFLRILIRQLALALHARHAFVGQFVSGARPTVQLQALWSDGKWLPNVDYELAGTPCEIVLGNGGTYFDADISASFPQIVWPVASPVVSFLGAGLYDSQGETLGVLAVMHDEPLADPAMAETILALFATRAGSELERAQYEASLRESEELHRLLVEQSNDAIYLLFNNKFEIINQRFSRMFGISPAEARAPDFDFIELVAPESREGIRRRARRVDRGEHVNPIYEFQGLSRQGRVIPLEASLTYLDYRGGTAVQGVLHDLTRRNEVESALREQRELAETLREVAGILNSSLDHQQVLDLMLEQLARVVEYDGAAVVLRKNGTLELAAKRGLLPISWPLTNGDDQEVPHIRQALMSRLPVYVADTGTEPGWQELSGAGEVRSWLGVPLSAQNGTMGVLMLSRSVTQAFPPNSIAVVSSFATHAAIAISNARLYAATNRLAEELRVVGDILRALNAVPDVDQSFPQLVRGLKTISRCERVSLALLHESQMTMTFMTLDEEDAPLIGSGVTMSSEHSSASQSVLEGEIHLTPDLAAELDFPGEQVLYDLGYRSRVNLPLRIGEKVLGIMNLAWRVEEGYQLEQLPLLIQISDAVALAIERSQLFAATRQRARELDLLNRVVTLTPQESDVGVILQAACQELTRHFNVSHVLAVVLDEEGWAGEIKAEVSPAKENRTLGQKLDFSHNPVVQKAVSSSETIYVRDKQQIDMGPAHSEQQHLHHSDAFLVIPIPVLSRVVGLIRVDLPEQHSLSPDELALGTILGKELGRALETAQLYDQLQSYTVRLEQRVEERTGELAAANERLQELDRLKSKFISDISHELRTPVASLKLYLDLLDRVGPDKQLRYRRVLKQQTFRLEQLVDDVLDLSHLEESDADFKQATVDLNALIRSLLVDHRPRAEASGLQMLFSEQSDLPLVWGDAHKLVRAMLNLLENALTYTQSGYIQVTTEYDAVREEISVQVQDTGIGVQEDELPHLFERFYRGEQTSQMDIPGTGLGLAIVKEIVELHGGRVAVESQLGLGTAFTLRLPPALGQARPVTQANRHAREIVF